MVLLERFLYIIISNKNNLFFKIAAAGCILMQNIGAMSSYMFIIKNQLPSVLWTMMCPLDENGQTTCPDLNSPDIPWYFNGNYIVILIVCVVVVPLASLKSIEFLGYTSGNDYKSE